MPSTALFTLMAVVLGQRRRRIGKVCSRFWAVCAGPSAIWNQVRWQQPFAEKRCAERCDRFGSDRDAEADGSSASYLSSGLQDKGASAAALALAPPVSILSHVHALQGGSYGCCAGRSLPHRQPQAGCI